MTPGIAVQCAVAFVFAGISLAEDVGGFGHTHVGEYNIIGGTDVAENEFPFQVMLKRNGIFYCGGTILGKRHVLTAAHCVDSGSANEYTIVAGDRNITDHGEQEQTLTAKNLFVHELYENYRMYDIAIIKLDGELRYTPSVKHVVLSTSSFDSYAEDSTDCWITGYGLTRQEPDEEAEILQKANIAVIGNNECNAEFAPYDLSVNTENVCTLDVEKTACFGDSGGPVGCYLNSGVFKQVGVTSWGLNNCTLGPTVFTRVSSYRGWIRDTMHI